MFRNFGIGVLAGCRMWQKLLSTDMLRMLRQVTVQNLSYSIVQVWILLIAKWGPRGHYMRDNSSTWQTTRFGQVYHVSFSSAAEAASGPRALVAAANSAP